MESCGKHKKYIIFSLLTFFVFGLCLLNLHKNNFFSIVQSDMSTKVSTLCNGITLCLCGFYVLLIFLILFKKISLNKLFLASALVLGSAITLIIPIGNVPDEENAHMGTVYHYSNVLMGVEDGDLNHVKIRKCDEDIPSFKVIDDQKFETYLSDLSNNTNLDETMIESKSHGFGFRVDLFTYFFSTIGFTIGRLLHLNGILCFLIGRFFNFAVFLIAAYWCLSRIKNFKEILMMVCLLPITLQQACSLSYDSATITLSLLIITLTVNLYTKKKLTKKEKIALIVSCVLLIPCKGFMYPLLILAPLSFFLTKVDFSKPIVKKLLIASLSILLFLSCAIIILCHSVSDQSSLFYLVGHPKMLTKILLSTFESEFYIDVQETVGCLGLMQFRFNNNIYLLYFIFMVYVVIKSKSTIKIPIISRCVFVAIIVITTAGSLIALYPQTYSGGYIDLVNKFSIEGFQGRYFIPILIPFLIAFTQSEKLEDVNLNQKVLTISSLLCILCVFETMSCL